jgi:hypothetical protein
VKAKKSEFAKVDSLVKKALFLEIETLQNPTPLTQSVIERQSSLEPPEVTTSTPKLKASSAPAPAAQSVIPQQAPLTTPKNKISLYAVAAIKPVVEMQSQKTASTIWTPAPIPRTYLIPTLLLALIQHMILPLLPPPLHLFQI